MNTYRLIVVETVTYEREIEAKSIKDIQDKINNWEYDDFTVDHSHIVGADLQDIYVEEVE